MLGHFKIKGCEFSDFSLISDFFILTHLKIIFEISHLEHISRDFMIYSDFHKQKKKSLCVITDFFTEPDSHS